MMLQTGLADGADQGILLAGGRLRPGQINV